MTARAAPYPADTRAKGWRFELDMERVRQSDTWTLAAADAKPWLLLLWATAWEQTPCGSLPSDDALISSRLGMTGKAWAKHKAVLLRRWWLADDGRLYHDVLAERVGEMMRTRRKEADRKALARGKPAQNVPRDNHGTPKGLHPESGTGTGTGTGTGKQGLSGAETGVSDPENLDFENEEQTPAGAAYRAAVNAGITGADPAHPELAQLLAAGVTPDEIGKTAKALVSKGKVSWAYLLRTVAGRRQDAAAMVTLAAVPASRPAAADDRRAGEFLRQLDERAAAATLPPPALRRKRAA